MKPETVSLERKRVAVLLYSKYPNDPRPRRAAEALAGEGMPVELICLRQNDQEPTRETINGVEVLRLPIRHRRGGALGYLMNYGLFFLACFFIMSFRACRRRYHLVHVHNMPDFLVFAALVPRLLGAKVILDLHDPMPELMQTIFGAGEDSKVVRVLRIVERASIAFSHRVLTVSDTFRKVFASRVGRPEKIKVMINTPDDRIFGLKAPEEAAPGARGDKLGVMYHGSLVGRNGLGLAIEALDLVRESHGEVELRIYGEETPFLREMLEKAEKSGLANHLSYQGPRDLNGIVEAIDECDLGVVPNLKNAFTEINTPTRIFEFLRRGKGVIAPDSDGVREFFNDDQVVFFELGNHEDLARKMEWIASEPQKVSALVRHGQEVCRERSWPEEKRRFLSLVSGLLQGQHNSNGVSTPEAGATRSPR